MPSLHHVVELVERMGKRRDQHAKEAHQLDHDGLLLANLERILVAAASQPTNQSCDLD